MGYGYGESLGGDTTDGVVRMGCLFEQNGMSQALVVPCYVTRLGGSKEICGDTRARMEIKYIVV